MYRYDEFDASFVNQRTEQFKDQVRRRMAGELSEDEFKPLRLMNGLYLQLHAYMLRVAVPLRYAERPHRCASSRYIARTAGTRVMAISRPARTSSINWPKFAGYVPDMLEAAGRCRQCTPSRPPATAIRNVTADHFAGAAADEIEDPAPLCGTAAPMVHRLHPEFSVPAAQVQDRR